MLGGSQGECHTRYSVFLRWWRRWWWWWSDLVFKGQEILQPTDDAPKIDDMLLMHNIFKSEALILYANHFKSTKSFNLSMSKVSKTGFKYIFLLLLGQQCLCYHWGWIHVVSLPLSPLMTSVGSSLFVSIVISQASSSMWLEEQEDMPPSLTNLARNNKKREQRIFSMI